MATPSRGYINQPFLDQLAFPLKANMARDYAICIRTQLHARVVTLPLDTPT
jgi:hypothetical protein